MSHPEDADKPVVKDKDPHNYRKVGFSMIVISVSLVAIGLLVWAVGDNYHFSSDIMAAQEVDAMTPKSGYSVIVFDYTQPIGAKLKLLAETSSLDDAIKQQADDAQQYVGQKPQVLIFDSSKTNNTSTVALAEVYALTPNDGYQILQFNTALPVGAKLSSLKADDQYTNATNDIQFYADQIKDPAVHIIIFSTSFDDNLKQILGDKYSSGLVTNNPNKFPQKPHIEKPVVPAPVTTNATQTNQTTTQPPVTNQTVTVPNTNMTTITPTTNTTSKSNATVTITSAVTTNATANQTKSTNQTIVTPPTNQTTNQTSTNASHSKSVNLSENIAINSTGH